MHKCVVCIHTILDLVKKIQFDGVDFSEGMLAEAKELNFFQRLKLADLTKELPFEQNEFDGMFSSGVYGMHVDVEYLWNVAFNYLKQNGIAVIAVRQSFFHNKDWLKKILAQQEKGLLKMLINPVPTKYVVGENSEHGYYIVLQKQ